MPVILRTLVEETLLKIVLSRMIMTIERRINSRLTVDLDQLAALDWVSIENRLLEAIDQNFQDKLAQLRKPESQIQQNIKAQIRKQQESGKDFNLDELATGISIGTQAVIDSRTHQKVNKRVALLNYIYLAALGLENEDPEEISADILEHLEGDPGQDAVYLGQNGNPAPVRKHRMVQGPAGRLPRQPGALHE